MTDPQQSIHLTLDQAKAIYGALIMRPTIETQLQELINHDASWSGETPKLKHQFDLLEAIYKTYGQQLYKHWPPSQRIGAIQSEINLFTKQGVVKIPVASSGGNRGKTGTTTSHVNMPSGSSSPGKTLSGSSSSNGSTASSSPPPIGTPGAYPRPNPRIGSGSGTRSPGGR